MNEVTVIVWCRLISTDQVVSMLTWRSIHLEIEQPIGHGYIPETPKTRKEWTFFVIGFHSHTVGSLIYLNLIKYLALIYRRIELILYLFRGLIT